MQKLMKKCKFKQENSSLSFSSTLHPFSGLSLSQSPSTASTSLPIMAQLSKFKERSPFCH